LKDSNIKTENDLPDMVEGSFFVIITIVLVIAIQKFRRLSNRQSGLQESKLAVRLHLALFLAVCLSLLSYLMFETIYLATKNDLYHLIVNWLRVLVQIFTCALETFIAYMLYKLTYPGEVYLLDEETASSNDLSVNLPTDVSSSLSEQSSGETPSYIKSFLARNEHLDQRIFGELTIQVQKNKEEENKFDNDKTPLTIDHPGSVDITQTEELNLVFILKP